MTKSCVILVCSLVLSGVIAVPLSAGQARGAPAATRTVYVSVVDGKGVPVTDLTAADFRVKEDGKARQVVSAGPSQTPMTVALLVDDSGLGLQSIREGAAAFITRLGGRAQVAIVTTGGRNNLLVGYTNSTATLMAGINKIYARNAPGAFLLEGLLATAKSFADREVTRPVIVSVAVEGGEEYSDTRAEEVMNTLLQSRTQVHIIRLGRMTLAQSNPVDMVRGESLANESIQLNSVLGQAPSRTGGRSEQLAQHSGIPKAMDQIAIELLSEYALTFDVADPRAREVKLEIETSRRGVKVRAPTRVGVGR